MKMLLILVLLATVSCATMSGPPATGDSVRVTTNPDVVHGCTFLGNVATGAWASFGDKNRPGWANEKWLRQDTEKLGGNVVYINSNDRSGASGEAYLCP